MRKSVVTAIVTTMFVVYSFYQRTVGVQANADVGPSPTVTSIASSSSQGLGGNGAPRPTSVPPTAPAAQKSSSPFKDGAYTGTSADAFYGNIQVRATISNGKLTDVQFVQWPNDRSRSVRINQQALPWLVQEAVQAQSANVDVISGATDSSDAFTQSLQSALSQAES